MRRPVALIIRDGWGYNKNPDGNAVASASTPNIDQYKKEHPWTLISCAGEPVGLPDGYQGSSEVGHLNMGAGRIVIQELKRIDDDLANGKLFETDKWVELITNWKKNNSRLHLLGLIQDEGVHAHQEHLFKIMKRARNEFPEGEIIIHPFLDGRDTPPKSTSEYLVKLIKVMSEINNCRVGTMMGRYYAMDRSKNWNLTDTAYHSIVCGEGRKTDDILEAVKYSYENDKTPDNVDMFDEYIPPHCIGRYDGLKDGDSILHTNYRQDRAIQLSKAFVEKDYPGEIKSKCEVVYSGLTRYYDEFNDYMMGPMDEAGGMENLLGEILSKAGVRQLRIAETQKFPHVTSFFNGKATTPFKGEDQVQVTGRFDPATFASHPEMEAEIVTEKLLDILKDNPYEFIAVNYANGDMVGHTGVMESAVKAIETVDINIGKVVKRLLELDAHILITSDHGNSEEMINYETGMTKTSHTLNPVEFIYISNDSSGRKLIPENSGKLADIAPTILSLLDLEIPSEMTAQNMFIA